MSSRWTHSVCESCYKILSPDREPSRMVDVKPESCCICGDRTLSGIYLRIDPQKTMCKGVHADDKTKKLEERP